MAKEKKELLYMKLKKQLLKEYEDKPYYSPLPGEREICEIYHVSRPTVRKALQLLEEEQNIVKIPGKGAFFTGASGTKGENLDVIAFYNQVRLRGDYTSSKVLTQKIEMADAFVAEKLSIKEGEKIFHLERLRYINGELCSISDSYVPYKICPELMEHEFSERSLHNTLTRYGFVPMKAKRHISVKAADEYEAFHLNLKEGSLLGVFETFSYNENDVLLEYARTRNDIHRLSIDMELYNGRPAISK